MRRFPWRSVMPGEEMQNTTSPEDPAAVESSPSRSYRSSTNSSIRGGGKAFKSQEGSPIKSFRGTGTIDGSLGAPAAGPNVGSAGVGTGGSEAAMSNKKMLKIGANVRFRGDVMECNTVVLCGRLQGFVETQRLTVKEGGKFVGDAKVEDADVYGSFEGALESTSKICVRSTGMVTGRVVYKGMSMEDGGEVEGTLRCSKKASRKESRIAAEAAEAAEETLSAEMGDNIAPTASVSRSEEQHVTALRDHATPPWQRRKEVDAGLIGSAAGASSTAPTAPAVVGEATPEPGSQPLPAASAAAAAAGAAAAAAAVMTTTGATAPGMATWADIGTASGGGGDGDPAAGVGPKSTSPLSIKWPPKQPVSGPAVVGTPRRGVPLPASSPPSRLRVAAPSPRRSPGLQQVQNLGPEAWEMFGAEEETSPGSIATAYASHAALEAVGKRASPSSTEATSEAPVVVEGGVSVAARVGTWPPASPAHSKAWNRRAEGVSPASAASPAAAPTVAPSATITPKSGLRKTLAEGNKPPPAAPAGRRHQGHNQNQNQNQVGPAPASTSASSGGDGVNRPLGGSRVGVGIVGGGGAGGPGGGNASGVENAPGVVNPPGVVNAPGSTNAPGGATVAAIGDGAGSHGEDQVIGAGAGEGVGEREGSPERGLEEGESAAAASEETEGQPSQPRKACEASDCGLEACWGDPRFRPRYCARHKRQGSKLMDPVELEEGDEAALPEGSPPPSERSLSSETLRGVVKGEAPAAAAAAAQGKADSEGGGLRGDTVGVRGVGGVGRAGGGGKPEGDDGNDDDDDDDYEDLEDDEDEDEGWGNGGADPRLLNGTLGVGRRLFPGVGSIFVGKNESAPQQQQQQQQQPEPQQKQPEPQQQSEPQQQPKPQVSEPPPPPPPPPQQQQQQQRQQQRQPQELLQQQADRRIHDAPAASVYDTGEVQAPEPVYERLASKKAMPSLKSKPFKPKKLATGNNIADFYGGGAESESDDETSFNMEAFSKVVRQQSSEGGTHTDDGQLRPQASQERDQQRIAHLVKVNKIGTFRGKGVTVVGKRR